MTKCSHSQSRIYKTVGHQYLNKDVLVSVTDRQSAYTRVPFTVFSSAVPKKYKRLRGTQADQLNVCLPNDNKPRGRPRRILPLMFNRDRALHQHPIRLHSSRDLVQITGLAQDRKCFKINIAAREIGEVSLTRTGTLHANKSGSQSVPYCIERCHITLFLLPGVEGAVVTNDRDL